MREQKRWSNAFVVALLGASFVWTLWGAWALLRVAHEAFSNLTGYQFATREMLSELSLQTIIFVLPVMLVAIVFWAMLPALILLLHSELQNARQHGKGLGKAVREVLSASRGLLVLILFWLAGTFALALGGDWFVMVCACALILFGLLRRR